MIGLLVVDMQIGLFEGRTRRDADGVVERINALIAAVRERGGAVVFIQHEGGAGTTFEPGTPPWEILPTLEQDPADPVISKTACDSFYRTTLADKLAQLDVDTLWITGCCTDFCIDTTVRSAASRDYQVIAVADAHTTSDRPHLPAEKIIEHHNWVWSNLIHPTHQVRVSTTAELLA